MSSRQAFRSGVMSYSMVSPSSNAPSISPKPTSKVKEMQISSLQQKREQKKRSMNRFCSSSDLEGDNKHKLTHSKSFLQVTTEKRPSRNKINFTSMVYKSVDNFERLRFNEETSDLKRNLGNMSATDIDKVDTIVDLPKSPIGRTLTESKNQNLPKFDALMKQYSQCSSRLEVITEKVRPPKSKKHFHFAKKENMKVVKNMDQEMSFSINSNKKSRCRGSMISNRKVMNATFDLLNDSPNSIEVRRPPKPYPFTKNNFKVKSNQIKAASVIQKAWKKHQVRKQATRKHKRNGSKIPQITKKKTSMADAITHNLQAIAKAKPTLTDTSITPPRAHNVSALCEKLLLKESYESNKLFASNSAIPPVTKTSEAGVTEKYKLIFSELETLFDKLKHVDTVPSMFKEHVKKDFDKQFAD